MIITRTPFRISFAGGGTDLKEYYSKEEGLVLSVTINKYMYITINSLSQFYDHKMRIAYSQVEMVNSVEEIRHPLVREAVRMTDPGPGVEIHSMADIPAGTGMGSSSSFTVGLLNALYAYKGRLSSKEKLASRACQIEIEKVGEPIGKQDQYAASFGGMNIIRFLPDESVQVQPLPLKPVRLEDLNSRLMLFYTGIGRKASDILTQQKKDTGRKLEVLSEMKSIALEQRDLLLSDKPLGEFGALLHRAWLLKRSLTEKISTSHIDTIYQAALDAGATGGKLLGAGGGGFLLFYVEPENRVRLREALSELREVDFEFDRSGSQVIYVS